ncbi:MAG: hypothetical protein ACI4IQ_06750 [Eubacterium sp.]
MKIKKFSHKLLALFMAIVMALTCFTGALTSYAASSDVQYNDEAVTYNSLAWKVLSDEQTATALLDYADAMLEEYGPVIDQAMGPIISGLGMGSNLYWEGNSRTIKLNFAGIITADIKFRLHNVDEIMETLESVAAVISDYSSMLGDAKNIQLGSTNGVRRSNTSSCDIIRDVLGILRDNSTDNNGKDVIGEFLRGGFDLGTVGNLANIDIYGMIGGLIGLDSGYESDLVYNLVQGLLFNYTNWFTDEEIAAYKANPSTFVYDDVLLDKMSTELLSKISVLVTYPDGTSSASRLEEIETLMRSGLTYEQAATQLGYDANLVYSEEEIMHGNVLLFEYGHGAANEHLVIDKNSNLLDFGYQALDLAWKTVLKDTVKLIHVNNNVDRGHGANFDNNYFYWASETISGGWDETNLEAMYSTENVNAWATAVYADYSFDSAEEFLDYVKHTYEFDRTIVEDPNYNWRDIDETTLFNKLRYSPLADYCFDMQTGPINLYFMQTGTANLDAFFEEYTDTSKYDSMVAALNNALVAAVKDLFPDRDNIYVNTKGDTSRPTLAETSIAPGTPISSTTNMAITNTLVSNALKMVQYTADTTDQNILSAFYHSGATELTEANLETAMIPLLVACIGQINLGSGQLQNLIHPADWDSCKDAEGVIYLCLEEYLSYVLPEKDYEGNYTASGDISYDSNNMLNVSYENVILPMARDAVVYVMEASVPVTYNGSAWRVKSEDTFSSDATLFDLLNSVVCYYANDYQLDSGRSMGIASLLGVCDTNGNSLVNESNTLWENLDIIVNTLVPVIGTLQYGSTSYYGKANSEDLIYNDIVKGILNIGDTSIHTSKLCGVSNFIYKLLTIVTAPPIASTAVEITVYDFLKDLLNGIFGPRYTSQTWVPIPDATSSTPFDALLKRDVIAGTDGSNIGVVQKAICNFVEFSGYRSGIDSILRGIMFAMQALNSFMPDVIPSIGDHQYNMATAEIEDAAVSGLESGTMVESNLVITNNCIGINNGYVNQDNIIQQLSRYYVKITNVTTNSEYAEVDYAGEEIVLEPTESVKLQTYSVIDGSTSTYVYTFTYDIVDKAGNAISAELTGLEGFAYQVLTSAVSWKDSVYPASSNGGFATSLEVNTPSSSATAGGYTTYTTAACGANSRLYFGYPEYIVASVNSLSDISSAQLRISNTGSNDDTIDGWYLYDSKTFTNASGQQVTVGINNPIPVWDKETGDLLNLDLSDYSTDDGATWNRGTNNAGYTDTEISDIINNTDLEVKTRTHIAYTFAEAQAAGIIASYDLVGGEYENVYLQAGTSTTITTLIQKISMRGPIDGLYMNSRSLTQGSGSSYFSFISYDGSTGVTPGTYDVNLCMYSSNAKGSTSNMKLVIGDDSNALSVNSKYNELSDLIANYKSSDFTDPAIYTEAREILADALATEAMVLTPETASGMNDKTVLTAATVNTTSEYGDAAFVPFTTSNETEYGLPAGVKNNAYVSGGIYYFDPACTMPIYSNVPLTAANVTDGKDPAGIPVIKGTDGAYYLQNMPAYEYEWTKAYGAPYYQETETQATNSNGALLYKQVQYVYRDSNSNKVNSTEDWYAKFPVTSNQLVPNSGTTDNRGTYSKTLNSLDYAIYMLQNNVKPEIALQLLNDISIVRNGLNSNNFDIASYNRMVAMAKKAESKYTIDINFIGEDGETYTHNVPFSSYYGYINNENLTILSTTVKSSLSSVQVAEYVRLFNMYTGFVLERGYRGEQLEKEILCASGNAYTALVATTATYDEDGALVTSASIARGSGATDAKFGTWGSDGTLINDDGSGNKIYTDASWNNYINALAEAVSLATYANTEYTHKASLPYVASEKDTYDAQVTDCYTKDSALQIAENTLAPYVEAMPVVTVADVAGGTVTIDGVAYSAPVEVEAGTVITVAAEADAGYTFGGFDIDGTTVTANPYRLVVNGDVTITPVFTEATGHTVSGSIVVATRPDGTTTNKAAYGDYTFTLYSDAARTVEVGSFTSVYDGDAKTNTFSATLADGTYYATLTYDYAITRSDITIIVDGADTAEAVIPVVACDFDKNTSVNVLDTNACVKATGGSYSTYAYCDLDANGAVNVLDVSIVLTCSAKAPSYPAITIQ